MPEQKVWQTANLWWWDFQKRRWRTINFFMNLKNRAEANFEKMKSTRGMEEVKALWDEFHVITAREIREFVEDHKGLFVKACQSLSAIAHGILPDAYIEEFTKVTEQMPISTLDEVSRMIRRNLGQSLLQIFTEFNPDPIGSASVAQVHKARLRGTGELVAVKVQHEGVDRLCWEDADTLCWVAQRMKGEAKELDFVDAMEELRAMLSKELDFREECRAASHARSVLQAAGSHVRVPMMHESLSGQHVVVMEFIDAYPIMKLQDPEFCKEHKLDKKVILEELVNAFGIMFFKDGLVHMDPHAGNVRLIIDPKVPGGGCAVLLDWGLFAEISDQDRLGMAMWFHSIANFDMAGVFNALEVLGIKIRLDMMAKLLKDSRGMLEESKTKQEVKRKFEADMEKLKAKVEAKERGEELKDDEDASFKGPDHLKSQRPAVEMEGFPKCLASYARMMQLVKGLCTAVDAAGIPVLRIFTNHAREALVEASLKQSMAHGQRGVQHQASSDRSEMPSTLPHLEARMQDLLLRLCKKRHIVGAQLTVIENGRTACNVVAGTLSTVDMRPVQKSTHFRLMGMTSGIASLALLRTVRRLVDDASISARCGRDVECNLLRERGRALFTPVTNIWPKFGGGEGCTTTLADILGYTAGVHDAYPKDFPLHLLDEPAIMEQHFESVSLHSGQEGRYAYLLNPFILAKIGMCLSGKESLLQWLQDELGPLGLDIAAPAAGTGSAYVCRDIPADAFEKIAREEGQKDDAKSGAKEAEEKKPLLQGQQQAQSSSPVQQGPPPTPHSASPQEPTPASSFTAAAAVMAEAAEAASSRAAASPQARTTSLMQAVTSNPVVFDPLFANCQGNSFRAGLSLGASAHGLAKMLSSEALRDDMKALGALRQGNMDPTGLGWRLAGGACKWSVGGLQVVDVKARSLRSRFAPPQDGYGVICGFGPCVLHFPDMAPGGVTIAVTVNDVTWGHESASELIARALAHYGYAPAWTSIPVRIMMEVASWAAHMGKAQLPGMMQSARAGLRSKLSAACGICARRASR